MNGTKYVIQKELDRVFKDKKLVFSLFLLPAVLMIGIYLLMGKLINIMVTDVQEHVPTIYVQNMPDGFNSYVEQLNFPGSVIYFYGENVLTRTDEGEKIISTEEIKENIRSGRIDLLVVFEEDFLNQVENYEEGSIIPEIRTYYNPAEDYSEEARNKFMELVINKYKTYLLAKRIGDLNQIMVFDVDRDPAASYVMDETRANAKTLSMMLPYLVIMLLFTGPMNLGIDAITGEKERGTLASMLITPMQRGQLVLGKLLALSILSCLSAVVYSVSIIVGLPDVQKVSAVGNGTVRIEPVQMVWLFIVMVVLVYLYVTIVGLIAVLSKSSKEAGSYISPVYIIVILSGIMTMFAGDFTVDIGMFGIPVYGSAIAIQKITTNELTLAQFGVNVISTVCISAILTIFIIKAFNSEKVMFNV
ncbi:ABC transporter permease [Anaeromicropila populeti]|uniref:Sodium transport system permease protein n=1 Tax=Anaeromicropila populeti TaxID=37658 RepID=A0A1I6IY26_9FIRM|nr:ABC transporter permease [Anaeromicropila populeti]SFR71603.1 sodium transport system permease protein [Anaeromicropila populeti]